MLEPLLLCGPFSLPWGWGRDLWSQNRHLLCSSGVGGGRHGNGWGKRKRGFPSGSTPTSCLGGRGDCLQLPGAAEKATPSFAAAGDPRVRAGCVRMSAARSLAASSLEPRPGLGPCAAAAFGIGVAGIRHGAPGSGQGPGMADRRPGCSRFGDFEQVMHLLGLSLHFCTMGMIKIPISWMGRGSKEGRDLEVLYSTVSLQMFRNVLYVCLLCSCITFWPHPQQVAVPGPGKKPALQQRPKLLQGQCLICWATRQLLGTFLFLI